MKSLLFFLSLLTLPLFAHPFAESGMEPWGVDADLTKQTITQPKHQNHTIPSRLAQSAVRFFQIYISPIDGPRSSYYPCSSRYTLEAIRKYGVLRGVTLGCDRLLRENEEPWVYDVTYREDLVYKYDPVR